MSFRVRIDHLSRYEYAQPVGLSPHLVRVFPRTEPGRLVQKIEFSTHESADIQYRRDLYDNSYARCYYPDLVADLWFQYAVEMEIQEQNAFHFLLDFEAAEFPFSYAPDVATKVAPFLNPPGDEASVATPGKLLPLPCWEVPPAGTSTVTMLVGLVEALHTYISYEAREEGAARPAADTLRLRQGSCRDIAVLLAVVLRELGLAARLVSGYLCEFGTESNQRRAEGAMHLWTEVYLPGAGWTGLDATNGIFCNHNFIATATGLTTAEVTPIAGRYFSSTVVPATMTANLTLTML